MFSRITLSHASNSASVSATQNLHIRTSGSAQSSSRIVIRSAWRQRGLLARRHLLQRARLRPFGSTGLSSRSSSQCRIPASSLAEKYVFSAYNILMCFLTFPILDSPVVRPLSSLGWGTTVRSEGFRRCLPQYWTEHDNHDRLITL